MFIAGHYTAAFTPPSGSSASIGDTREGFRLRENHHKQDIQTDTYGDGEVDGVGRGLSAEVQLDYVDYDLIRSVLYGQNPIGDAKSNVGLLLTTLAGQLVLTPVSGTTAASNGGGAFTATKAIVTTDIETMLASKLRSGPCTFKLYPNSSTGKLYTFAS